MTPHVEFAGVDYGGPLYLLWTIGVNLVIWKPAYSGWAGIGMRSTHPACVYVGTRFVHKEGGDLWIALFYEAQTGKAWKKVREDAVKVAGLETCPLPPWGLPLVLPEEPTNVDQP